MDVDQENKSRKICYVGNFSFPKGNSSGTRVLANGYLFRDLGFETVYFGLARDKDSLPGGVNECKVYDGFEYYEFPYPGNLKGWIEFKEKYKSVVRLLEEIEPYAVVAYGSMSNAFFTLFLGRWCKAKGIRFVTDCVDWLAGGSGSLLFRIGKRLDTELQKRYVNATADGVIVVSSFLEKYYSGKGCKTLVLPPILGKDAKADHSVAGRSESESTIRIAYAGFPFPTTRKVVSHKYFKDRLDLSVELLSALSGLNFVFDVYGITERDYLTCVPQHAGTLDKLGKKIRFHGVVSNDEVVKHVSSADYFFLYRDSNKMTNSGFPSKIVESISLGVPVITTATSDLDEYLIDGKHGFFLSAATAADRVAELEKVLTMDRERLEELKDYCRNNNPFLPARFAESTGLFLNGI